MAALEPTMRSDARKRRDWDVNCMLEKPEVE